MGTTTVRVNGRTITSSGNGNVVVVNGRVVIDGIDVTPANDGRQRQIKIEVHGNLGSLKVDACEEICINGSVGDVKVEAGDVRCGEVSGSVNVEAGDIRCSSRR